MKGPSEWRRHSSSAQRCPREASVVPRGVRFVAAKMSGYRVLALIAAGLFATVGCMPERAAGSPTASLTSSSGNSEFSAPQASDCLLASPQPGLAEVKGSNLWALVFAPLPIKAGTDTKIVWRMGGHGDFHIAAKATDATTARLTFG